MSNNESKKPANPILEETCRTLLKEINEDPKREGLIKTPQRYAQALADLTVGYNQDINKIVNGAIFHEDYSEMVIVKDIEFYSLCEHHILPFFGRATVAYIPNGKIIGLSKIPRIVKMFARRLQVQERMTDQITDAISSLLAPQGVACLIRASHMCMMMRGIQQQGSSMVTSSMRGIFLKNRATRNEFMKIASSN